MLTLLVRPSLILKGSAIRPGPLRLRYALLRLRCRGLVMLGMSSIYRCPWLQEQPDNAPARLERLNLRDAAAFERAAPDIGLKKSDNMIGWVEGGLHEKDGRLTVRGWAADRAGTGDPISVIVLAKGKVLLKITPSGPRDDVAKDWGLSTAVVRNVDVKGTSTNPISCTEIADPIVFSLNQKGEYGILGGGFPLQGC
jgi:hypothetical protein